MTRLPRLLTSSMTPVCVLNPSSLSLTLNLSDTSTAQMVLPPSDTTLKVHDLVEVYTHNGSAGTFRVVSMKEDTEGSHEYSLMHGIDTLSDSIFNEETDFSGTVAQFLTAVLAKQKTVMWTLGTCADSGNYAVSIKYERLSELIRALEDHEQDYYFDFDQTVFPWVLNFNAKPSTVVSEIRMERNLEKCDLTWDDSDMCTRLYLGVSTESVDQETGSPTTETEYSVYNDTTAQSTWGIIEKTEEINSADYNVQTFVSQYFDAHGQPFVQIHIDGYELNRLSGDAFDRFELAQKCRANFVDRGITLSERIMSITYPDVLGTPDYVTLELANKAFSIVSSMSSMSSSISEVSSEVAEEKEERQEQANEQQRTIIEHGAELVRHATTIDEHGETLHSAGIEIDPIDGVWIFAKRQGALGTELGYIDVKANEITSYVGMTEQNKGENLYSKITQNATSIQSEVTRATGAETTLSSRITQTATEIRTEVSNTASGLSSRITQNADSIELNAQNIRIIADDYVTINRLQTEIAAVQLQNSQSISTTTLTVGTGTATNFSATNLSGANLTVGGHSVSRQSQWVVTGVDGAYDSQGGYWLTAAYGTTIYYIG